MSNVTAGAALAPTTIEIVLPIEGMTCSSCVARVEKALKAVPGVGSAEVNLATETANVTLAAGARPETLVEAVHKAGYEARLDVRPAAQGADRSWWPVAMSAALALPLMLPMLAEPFGAALLMTRDPTGRTIAELEITLDAQPREISRLRDAALERLRTGNPSARALPLLAALAGAQTRSITLERDAGQTLSISARLL